MPSSAVICSLGEARAFVIVLACKPCSASTVVQLIAELKAVLCASAIVGRLSFIFRYYVSSHFVMQYVRCCCMKRLTFGWIEGYAPSCDLHDTDVSIDHAVDETVHEFFSFVIDE